MLGYLSLDSAHEDALVVHVKFLLCLLVVMIFMFILFSYCC